MHANKKLKCVNERNEKQPNEHLCPPSQSEKGRTLACEPACGENAVGNLPAPLHRSLGSVLFRAPVMPIPCRVIKSPEITRSP